LRRCGRKQSVLALELSDDKAVKTNRTRPISILLNFALLGGVISLLIMHHRQTADSASGKDPVTTGAPAAHTKPADHLAPQRLPQPRAERFDWRQVESEDYKDYIANLRAIGCPEKTIRDIITADVNDLFSSRRSAITKAKHYEYWRANPVNLSAEEQKQLRELNTQKYEVLKALGIESSDSTGLMGDFLRPILEAKELELEFLPEPKRQSLKDLLFRLGQERLAAGNDRQRLDEIEQQTRSAIRSLLTPDEFRDYELRTSLPAVQLRFALKEIEPTETEFRTIFDTWISLNAHPWGSPEYRQAQQSSETALQQLLGPSRFDLYLEGVKQLGY